MKREDYFAPSDRYRYDFGMCSAEKGYCQVDTNQDAHYFGIWTNPHERKIVKYMEGDVSIQTADSDEEYVNEIRRLADAYQKMGDTIKIDCYTQPREKEKLESLGLGDLLH